MSVLQTEKRVVAAFDFDGTLTRHDTMFPFLLYVVGMVEFVGHIIMLAPTLIGYGLGVIRNDVAKERVFTRFLSGMEAADLHHKADLFAQDKLPNLMRHNVMQRVAWHKQQGHHCVLISASLEFYLRPWAIPAGFDDVIATHLDVHNDGSITGKLLGSNCYGKEKVRRLEALLGDKSGYTLYAYGDSRGDRELLTLADYPYYRYMPN